ncbi:MAG: YjhG/YagF family D-xylonate dehydratase [Planctomycetia bacterium]|nr:YjhG/YagF family D-xylonate dehydratase [Planctomycetia bacterium]
MNFDTALLEADDAQCYEVTTKAPGPTGKLPLTDEMLKHSPSGDLFGWTQNAGMGWDPITLQGNDFLLLSTHGGLRNADGTALALGYHTGHWEVNLLVAEAARELKKLGATPFAAYVTDPCDGRTQGTTGMFDSLPYRNDAAMVMRRLIRSLPTCKGVMGIATCDKGLPATMMALASCHDLPAILVPGGVTLPAEDGEDAGKVQTIGIRYIHGLVTLEEAAELGCRACGSPGGGCQFLGTAASAQLIGEALGLTLPHAALAPSGQPIWKDLATRSARALMQMRKKKITTKNIFSDGSARNAMAVFAAAGGSTNMLFHIPAILHQAKLERPSLQQWMEFNRKIPRLVDALPNGPVGHPTIRVFLAGGVPEIMLHLRELHQIDEGALTVTGEPVGRILDAWRISERRKRLQDRLFQCDGVDPADVIMSPQRAGSNGLTSTVVFPTGNLVPQGSVIKSTAIDRSMIDENGIFRHTFRARVFTTETAAMQALKAKDESAIKPGDVIVLICRGPMGAGMEETYQITAALKHLPWGKQVAVLTDARFSGVSTGACIGHVSPEALAGGPIGKLIERDLIEIIIDQRELAGSVNLIGHGNEKHDATWGNRVLESRAFRTDLRPDSSLPEDTKLWAALIQASGGVWGGCVYDVDRIMRQLKSCNS